MVAKKVDFWEWISDLSEINSLTWLVEAGGADEDEEEDDDKEESV